MKIALASDHGGFEQKQQLASWLAKNGHEVIDCGTDSTDSCDYPDFAQIACNKVAAGEARFGILVCGTGIGMSIAANKIAGIRAANVTSPDFAVLSREHNDANVITLSGRFVSLEQNEAIVDKFLTTEFGGDRHARRVAKINALD